MSQRTALQDLDADLHAAFADVGLAEAGLYTDAALTDAPVRVYVNRDTQAFGSNGEVIGAKTVLQLFRADVDAPKLGARVVIDAEAFLLEGKVHEDESLTHWVVGRG